MNNMGGLLKLYYIDASDFESLIAGENNLFTLQLREGAVISEIVFATETGKLSESEEDTDNGIGYNFEVLCGISKCSPENVKLLADLPQKRLLILAHDNNDRFWLAGVPGSYFTISTSSSTGTVISELNGRQLRISAKLAERSVFINSPF